MKIQHTFDEEVSAEIRLIAERDEESIDTVVRTAITMFIDLTAVLADGEGLTKGIEIEDSSGTVVGTLVFVPLQSKKDGNTGPGEVKE